MHSSIKNPKYKRSKKDVRDDQDGRKEQSVEIEMNDSVRNLLFSSDKCKSQLLDVMIIKSNDEKNPVETNTLNGIEVRKLLAGIEKENREKRMINELFEDKSGSDETIIKIAKHIPRRKIQASSDLCYDALKDKKPKSKFHRTIKSRNNQSSSAHPVDRKPYSHCYPPVVTQVSPVLAGVHIPSKNYDMPSEDSGSDVHLSVDNFKCGDHKKTHHVYAAPRTYKDLNSIITCQSMSKDTDTPCLCEHCGIASLLSETIKRPIITAPVEHVSELRRRMNRKDYRECSKHSDYQRRKKPEPSLSTEEKGGVFPPSLVHLFERVKILEERMDIQEERAVPKDYFKRIITKIITHFSPRMTYKNDHFIRDSDSETYAEARYKNNYSVNALMVDDELKDQIKKTKNNDGIWKWGGEVLKPGIDLKNKIMSLLDLEKKRNERPKTSEDKRRKIKKEGSSPTVVRSKEFNSEAFKSFVEAMSAKIYGSHKKSLIFAKRDSPETSNQTLSDTSLYKKPKHEVARSARVAKPQKIAKAKPPEAKKVNVSYLNPKLSTWQEEESQISFRLEFSDADTSKSKESKNKDLEKLEFLKTLSRTKDSDKEKLWDSIWAQAKANGQSKQDKVTIQLPRKNENNQFNDMIEIEFTIAEIEYMLTKHKFGKLDAMVKDKIKNKS